ncbi:MAG: hypothetical protein AAFV95_00370 [Bacteroidota bacterium]
MRHAFLLLALCLLACNSGQNGSTPSTDSQESVATDEQANESPVDTLSPMPAKRFNRCWEGTIAGEIPVFLHYQQEEGIVLGAITYLNTKARTPIRLLGTYDENGGLLMREYSEDGNVTGLIVGDPASDSFSGTWYSPEGEKEMTVLLSPKDSLIPSPSMEAEPEDIFGTYAYQYGEKGYLGDLDIRKDDNGRIQAQIVSLTKAPARNIADVEMENITLEDNSFVYSLPEADSCAFQVRFFKDFAYVTYTQSDCMGQFGHRATVEGMFVKVPKERETTD